jgi:hypothetical protein
LESWKTIVTNVNNFLDSPPENWSLLTLGYIPFRLLETNDPSILKVKCAYDAHAYIVNLDNFENTEFSGTSIDGELFCGGKNYKQLVTNPLNILQGEYDDNVYAIYPQLFKQKTEQSYNEDMSLLQDYYFMIFGGHNNVALVSKYINSFYFVVLMILVTVLLCFKPNKHLILGALSLLMLVYYVDR